MLSGGRSITGDYYQTPRKAQIKIMLAIAVAVPNGIDIRISGSDDYSACDC